MKKRDYFPPIPGLALSVIVLLLILSILTPDAVSASEEGKEHLKKGKEEVEAGRFADAVKDLLLAEKGFPLLGDYALLYLSQAYQNLGDHKKALEAAGRLVKKYPDSRLVRKARMTELTEALKAADARQESLLQEYIRDYPGDDEAAMIYADFLSGRGDTEKAAGLYKEVYLRGGSLSGSARAKMKSAELTPEELIDRATNLMKRYEFREAEREMRAALPSAEGDIRDDITRNIASCLFRQRSYSDAAVWYDKVGDTYYKARSLYRAGDQEGFDKTLKALMTEGDERAGSLLLADACDKRKDGDLEKALKLYSDVLSRYPSEREEALWGMGWTYYVQKKFGKASEMFARLSAEYKDPRYLYWQARSTEAAGGESKELYGRLAKEQTGFYGFLASIRNRENDKGQPVLSALSGGDIQTVRPHGFDRVEALASLNMKNEAVAELVDLSGNVETPAELLFVISKLEELGEYRHAIRLVTKVPYSTGLHRYLYPLAFWDQVEDISKKHEIDSLIVLAVMREESRFDAGARSAAGAMGLMQVMPRTAYRLDKDLKMGIKSKSRLNEVKVNIALGSYYLKSLFKEFKSLPYVLAAYNAGETAVRQWMGRREYASVDEFIEEIPYPETRNYVKKVLTSYFQYMRYFEPRDEGKRVGIVGKL
jgi:soluble lytic murein transglycosylase